MAGTSGSNLGMPLSVSHGRLYSVMPPKYSFCAPAHPTWIAAWARCATWQHNPVGGRCLLSRLAEFTSVTTASSVVLVQGMSYNCIVKFHRPSATFPFSLFLGARQPNQHRVLCKDLGFSECYRTSWTEPGHGRVLCTSGCSPCSSK